MAPNHADYSPDRFRIGLCNPDRMQDFVANRLFRETFMRASEDCSNAGMHTKARKSRGRKVVDKGKPLNSQAPGQRKMCLVLLAGTESVCWPSQATGRVR